MHALSMKFIMPFTFITLGSHNNLGLEAQSTSSLKGPQRPFSSEGSPVGWGAAEILPSQQALRNGGGHFGCYDD